MVKSFTTAVNKAMSGMNGSYIKGVTMNGGIGGGGVSSNNGR
jgi:hypothetical protein